MNTRQAERTPAKSSARYARTQYTNLVRSVASGVFVARLRVGGKLIRRSLETDVLSVAKLRLADIEKQERQLADSAHDVVSGRLTFGQLAAIHLERVNGDCSLKPRTKAYHAERARALFKFWPELERMEARALTKTECLNWAARFGADYGASAYNHTISLLRQLVEIGIEHGARYDNPARFIKRASERPKRLELPAADQFNRFVASIETSGSGFSKPCANLVRFLAFGGFRKAEAAMVRWADVDFDRDKIIVRGDPKTGTKNWSIREVPIIPDMRMLLERLRVNRPDDPPEAPVMRVRECQKAMDRAAKLIGIPRITHHDLRHLFATRCIESGVDIPTVSRWLGHKDGGGLAMKVYGHLRNEHSINMAKKVTFGSTSPEPTTPQLVGNTASAV